MIADLNRRFRGIEQEVQRVSAVKISVNQRGK